MKFLKRPDKLSAVIEMVPSEAAAYFMGGSEVFGSAKNGEEGVYYWLREGRWLRVEVVEDEAA